jgi:hypothetical protein
MTPSAQMHPSAAGGALSFGTLFEMSCSKSLTGLELAELCRVCERENVNIHQLLYLAYDDTSVMLRLTVDAPELPASLLTLLQRFS